MSEIKPGSIVTVKGWGCYGIVTECGDTGHHVEELLQAVGCWVKSKDITLVLPPLSDHAAPPAPVVDADLERERRQLWCLIARNMSHVGTGLEYAVQRADEVLAEFDKRFGQPAARKSTE